MLKPILLVEDDPRDLELTLVALERSQLANEVIVVRDGEAALDYLNRTGDYAGRDEGNPAVILLDLKLPKVNGLEVLQTVRNTDPLRSIPVVMLTSSHEETYVLRSYQLGVNAYVVKPVEFKQFGISPHIEDGSGLSRQDRTSPRQIVKLLQGMNDSPAAAAFDDSLPVVGRNGTMYNRMRGTAGQDNCHTKTGTLHDVSTLAGYCNTAGGERIAFAFLMNRVAPYAAHVLQDKMTVALARYTG